jgi:hypothetical protein
MDPPPFPFVIPSAAEESAVHLRALSSGKTGAATKMPSFYHEWEASLLRQVILDFLHFAKKEL